MPAVVREQNSADPQGGAPAGAILRRGVCVLALLLPAGCLTQSVRQAKDLSGSGIAYAEAVDQLLDIARDQVISFDNQELVRTRSGADPQEMLAARNTALLALLDELERCRDQARLLKIYFCHLQALANTPVRDDAGSAVRAASDSLSRLNAALRGRKLFSEEQQKYLGTLSGLVAQTTLAAQLRTAFTRDAEIIGTCLVLQEAQLEQIASLLQDRFMAANDLFLNEKVIAPYVNRDKALSRQWSADRTHWLKSRFTCRQLATARDAARQLRGVWADLLQDGADLRSVNALLADVHAFTGTVQALEAAREAP
jgi:hypothetical protein